MALKIQDAGTLRTITGMKIKQAGVLRTIKTLHVMDGGTLRQVAVFAAPLSVGATDTEGSAASGTPATITTAQSVALVEGGLSPFTYQWEIVANGGGNASTANSPTGATTTFTKTGVVAFSPSTDTWRVTVTDSVGTSATATLTAQFTNFGSGGAG